jgi:hypothetical protein
MAAAPNIRYLFHVEDDPFLPGAIKLFVDGIWNKTHPDAPLVYMHFANHKELEEHVAKGGNAEQAYQGLILSDNEIKGQEFKGSKWLLELRRSPLKNVPAIMYTSGVEEGFSGIVISDRLQQENIPIVLKSTRDPFKLLTDAIENVMGLGAGQDKGSRGR